ncbi:unnamed protein product [Linum trigynum]
MNKSSTPMPKNNMPPPQPVSNGSNNAPSIKNRMCNKYNTAEGCKYGDKCHFAHGEWELGRPIAPSHDDHHRMSGPPPPGPRIMNRMEPPPPGPLVGFGDTATAKISVNASLAGAIIGKGGVNSKQISRQTGAKLSIREHETDANLRNIELEGTFDQIGQASAMVKELIANVGPAGGYGHGHSYSKPSGGFSGEKHHPGSNYKTKICDNFNKGACSFGQRCNFAHGAAELRKTGV